MKTLIFLLAICLVCPAVSLADDYSTPPDTNAKNELRKASWVKDLYVSPGHMNIGVIPGEKNWTSPMIGNWACAILSKNGSKLNRVRFFNIVALTNQGKTVRDAEIHMVQCP